MSNQDYFQRSTPFYVSTQKGVDVSFTRADLTQSLDDFATNHLEPAMAQLAAAIESDCLTVAVNNTPEMVGTTNASLTFTEIQTMRQYLSEKLAPVDNRSLIMDPGDTTAFVVATSGLQNPASNVSQQFREGSLGRTGGLDVSENTLMPSHTNGSCAGSILSFGASLGLTTTTANTWASTTTLSVTGATSATTLLAGDVITLSGVYEVHPESKTALARLKKFVVTTNLTMTTAASTYSLVVAPAVIWGSGNAYQNAYVPGGTTTGLTVTLQLAASATYRQSLAFHRDAFVFATADLIDPSQYGAWGARDVVDGISVSIAQQFDIVNDAVPCRIDVLYGFAPLYPQLAVRALHV